MADFEIRLLPLMSDNYAYLLHDAGSGATAVVDPAIAGPVLEALEDAGWGLTHILCTHHHADHVGGVPEVKRATGCTVIAPAAEAGRIPDVDVGVKEGDTVKIGALTGRVIEVPGHTAGHVAFWFEGAKAVFCGDALFSLGCGRMFEGTAEVMWPSLKKLRDLPADTGVYCGHEYTNSNADFALSVDPDNPELVRRADEVLKLREAGKPTIPSTIGEERACNPFLRADDPGLQKAAGLAGRDAVAVFAEIRRRKDRF